jgi:hypothetical protein
LVICWLCSLFCGPNCPARRPRRNQSPPNKLRVRRRGGIVEISTRAAKLPWLSERTTRITIQKVERRTDGWYAAEEVPLRSRVRVKVTSPGIAKLHGLGREVKERLLSSTGSHAIVIGSVEEGRFQKQGDMIVEGKGQGIWRILRQK